MPMVSFAARRQPKLGNDVKALIQKFVEKLVESDEASGLHIEPIKKSADRRARTGRVDKFWRAVLFRVDPPGGETHYIYVGTWAHDEAIEMARKLILEVNPLNGVLELHEALGHEQPVEEPVYAPEVPVEPPLLQSFGVTRSILSEDFGFSPEVAERASAIVGEDTLLEFAESLETPWQQDVLLSLAANEDPDVVKDRLGLSTSVAVDPAQDPDQQIVQALAHPASKMQFAPIRGAEELRRIIEDGDFGAWRIFLHPEQRAYVERDYSGSFRLSGGAGTGKTVVLLHRARRLALNPRPLVPETDGAAPARVVLTTFTRALADNLRRDLERLDPSVTIANALGEPGVLIRGVDQLAAEVRALAGSEFSESAREVIGSPRESTASPRSLPWESAVAQAGFGLPAALQSSGFLDDEYTQIILPARICDANAYFRVRRPGRGVALDRGKRAKVWEIVEQMRRDQRVANYLSYGEIAAISAHWLETRGTTLADHVLVDEGQDLEPVKWQFLRALVAEGPNDLFIGEDAHQRIYGRSTVLKRFNIKIQGRSRRLTLNYRTTLENLRFALGVLDGETFEDLDADNAPTTGYRSARSGPRPIVHAAGSDTEQLDFIATEVARWLDEGVRPETIAVLTVTRKETLRLQEQLAMRGVAVTPLKDAKVTGDRPVVMTMYSAKGMEFSRVALYDISEGKFPPAWAYRNVAEEDLPDVKRNHRSLLYVAASRARDELVVTWQGERSSLL
ncbi:MAG: 3'-5' exonuclease [Microbacterium sp.]